MFKPLTLPCTSASSNTLLLPFASSLNRSPSFSPASLISQHNPLSITCRSAVQDPPQTSSSRSLYEVLAVRKNASPTEIKTAYRRLAKMYHPDAMCSPTEEFPDGRYFIEIHNAYETLSDPAARAVYDLSLRLVGSRKGERLSSGMDDSASLRFGFRRPGYYPTRRWETDQCW